MINGIFKNGIPIFTIKAPFDLEDFWHSDLLRLDIEGESISHVRTSTGDFLIYNSLVYHHYFDHGDISRSRFLEIITQKEKAA